MKNILGGYLVTNGKNYFFKSNYYWCTDVRMIGFKLL